MSQETDYVVKGAGASAMAFVDTMLRESDATFTIIDRRAAPGGHWNDAYPFVRLHQPSACYGVASRTLGHDRKDQTGFNRGLMELASGIEVADYFHQAMRDTFLPSGRVSYHPVSEVVLEDGRAVEFVTLLSGVRHRVEAKKAVVDATYLNTSIPLTHTRSFAVAEGVTCIPPNDLTRRAPEFTRFTVLGGGKTAIDSVSWLLANGAATEAISWVLPRDSWFINRASVQPGAEFLGSSLGAIAEQYEICAKATSAREIAEGMEAAGQWLRLDGAIWPPMFHGATVTMAELEQLRRIGSIVRKGHVKRIEADRMVMTAGEMSAAPGTLYVDCTARALAANVGVRAPVFSEGKIALQMIRQYQPTFSAALIAHMEASITDDATKQKFTQIAPMTDTLEDWVAMMVPSMSNQFAWMQDKALAGWIGGCRLDLFGAARLQPDAYDAQAQAALGRIRVSAGAAVQNLARLSAAAKSAAAG